MPAHTSFNLLAKFRHMRDMRHNHAQDRAHVHALRSLLLVFALALLPVFDVEARQGRRAAPARERAPRANVSTANERAEAESWRRARLVLVIVVDQFRYEYLERFGDLFVANGLRRLQREGASWSNAHYDHIPTETAPGHATILTGAWPAETGIIANDWYDRASKRRVNNVDDESVRLLGPAGERERPASPRSLLASTLGDELKLMTNGRSRVVGLSVKDRGAILPAGRMADAALWYSSHTGGFVSSTYYYNRLPAWAERFNEEKRADKFFGARWERLLPVEEYDRRAGPDDAEWERAEGALGHTFPHVLTGGESAPGPAFYNALTYSPYTNDMLVALAEQAITGERLGADADTDVLSIGFSANDIVGHRYGPYSHEVMDVTLRTDRQVAQLLDVVDARVGLRNTIVVFTADHGVAPVPEHAAHMQLPGGRVRPADVLSAVRNRFRARFAKQGDRDTTADYVTTFSNGHLYFDRFALERDGVSREEAERVAGEAALTVPGITRYFTRTQLENGAVSPADPLARRALHGYHPARSGDVVIVQEPFKYLVEYNVRATHGAPYAYDTHVPVIIMGGGLRAGRYIQPATPADIAPTLAEMLRMQPPSNSVGRVLVEAFK